MEPFKVSFSSRMFSQVDLSLLGGGGGGGGGGVEKEICCVYMVAKK